jgi:hypothetical protein
MGDKGQKDKNKSLKQQLNKKKEKAKKKLEKQPGRTP